MKSLKKTYSKKLEVKKSPVSGLGLFASKNFKKGERLFIVNKGKIRKASFTKKEAAIYPNDIAIDFGVWITPPIDNPWTYINHSCTPNAYVKGKVTIVASKAIRKDEEITIDYSTIEASPFWKLNCLCGSPKCRRTLRGFPYLSPSDKKKLSPYVPSFLKNLRN